MTGSNNPVRRLRGSRMATFLVSVFPRVRSLLRRFIHLLPFHQRFSDVIFPLAFTLVLSVLSYYACSDMKKTIVLAIIIFFIILLYQGMLYRMFFSRAFSSFVSSLKELHPVTQQFASDMMLAFITKLEGFRLVGDLIRPNSQINLKDMASSLEGTGVSLSNELYVILLAKAGDMWPHRLFATWDTSIVPIAITPYEDYFGILQRLYADIEQDSKVRIFVFQDESDFKKKSADRAWDELLEKHKTDFGFRKIYYCFRQQFEQERGAFPDIPKNINDIVWFEAGVIFKHKWIIAKNSKKTLIRSDKLEVDSVKEFFDHLTSSLEKKQQIIELT